MAKQHKPARKPSKIYNVPIAKMRVPPALVTQREFRKAHGDRIAADLDLDKLGYPVMNHRDGNFWILDGQHRIYAMKENGFETYDLPCEVYENLTDSEMAEIFLGRSASKQIQPFDRFHVSCTAGHKRENDIRRIIEANGLKITRQREEGSISAIASLGKVYDRSGDVVLGQVVRTLKNAYGGDPNAFDSTLIEGVGLVFNRYNGRTNEKEMATHLASAAHGVRGLMRRAESQRERTGNQKSQCVASAVVDIYNKGLGPRSKHRLPAWWKEATS
jgi:hypothetical protein